jgi:hypothetical protein
MPAGTLVTVPLPLPVFVTLSVNGLRRNDARIGTAWSPFDVAENRNVTVSTPPLSETDTTDPPIPPVTLANWVELPVAGVVVKVRSTETFEVNPGSHARL